MVKAIAAAAAAANALGDVTEDPDKKQLYENLSNPERSESATPKGASGSELVATEELILPTVSMLFMFLYFVIICPLLQNTLYCIYL